MAKNLEQILGYQAMLGVVEDIKTGVGDPTPPGFTIPTKPIEGNTGSYTRVEGTRKTARLVQYGSPSQRRGLKGVSTQSVTLGHFYEHIQHDPNTLQQVMDFNNTSRQTRGQQEIDRQTGLFFDLFRNARKSMLHSLLSLGAIYFDGDGDLLPSSSGAVTSIDFSVPAGNKNQLDWDGNGAIIGASWATAGTDIIADIKELRRASMQLTGYPLAHAFHGANLLDHFLTNTKLKELINRNQGFRESAAQGEIPAGFLNFQWHPMDTAMYQDADDTYRYWFGDDTVVFTPEPSADWIEWLEGTYLIPNSADVASNVSQALSQLQEINGFSSWCELTTDPVGIKQFAVDTVLPVLKVPSAVFIADVTP